jgi:outer membrane protein
MLISDLNIIIRGIEMKNVFLVVFLLTFTATTAQADAFALKFGAQGWQTTGQSGPLEADKNAVSLWAAIEHPIPIIPNAKIRTFDFDAQKDLMVLKSTDYLFYYEVLDNLAVDLDLGIGAHQIRSGEIAGVKFDKTLPAAYGALRFPFGTEGGLGLYAEGLYGSESSVSVTDLEAGVSFTFSFSAIDLHLLGGYRVMSYRLGGFDEEALTNPDFDGVTLGFEFDI